ncbi:endonuclease/exonuclease/phosphatase family protein [Cecembia calidifontis]|uniref:Endonuclease/exonuclease/phosphatase family metal-dependent hydrolase n=1 Tax=Cecembia calidifontis TaxID=1187080 RepID=A0A4Q7PDE0_9BACT|nr:endonuclease/exonuclease/phosphatase family protein [Cecembia calidifontis]RZS98423.1 endonuclease/exonuclease/phosphatase family metal-dependent hydrolase [Cecembia calidifontis]
MKTDIFLKVRTIFIFVLLCTLLPFSIQAQTLNIATYNIRFDNPNDIGNLWKDRAPHLINQIKFHQMDIIGTQEGLFHQLEEMKDVLSFPYIGLGRDKGGNEGEFSAVFYNPEKLIYLEGNTFWLSETPGQPSKGWDAALNRVCTWGKFRTKKGKKEFYVFNIHYDHIGQKAREESSRLVLTKIKEINSKNLPVIFMGDFNVTPDNPAYRHIIESSDFKDSRLISQLPSIGNQGTFNGFNWEKLPEGIIDHIFVSPKIKVNRHGILTDNYGLKYPSDHFPVMAEISW